VGVYFCVQNEPSGGEGKNRVNVISGPLENSIKLEKSQFMTPLINYATVFCVKYASDG